jgi:preprotein translocase subunit YajC
VWAIVWLALMAGTFYFLIWRPQQRRVAAMRALQSALELGDEIITTSGIYGTITALRDDHVEVEIAPNVVVKLARGAVGTRLTGQPALDDGLDGGFGGGHDDEPGPDGGGGRA